MAVDVIVAILLYAACIVMIGSVASAEVALASTPRIRIRQLIERGDPSAKRVDRLLSDPARFLSTLMLAKNGAFVLAGAVIVTASLRQEWSLSVLLPALFAGWFLLVCVQIVGRAYTLRNSVWAALTLGQYVNLLIALLLPFSALLRGLGNRVRNGNEEASAESIFLSEDGLRFLLHVGEGEGVIEEVEKQMIAGIFEFGDTTAREIMVPRLDVTAIASELTVAECLPIILSSGHSRIPVYQENIDNIVGLLYAKDLLRCFMEERSEIPLIQILRPAYFVPQSKKLDDLLRELQVKRIHMAIIVDEYGGTAGIVTIEDMIEEIVGDIRDEYDSEDLLVQTINPYTHLFNARVSLDEVSELIEIDLSEAYDNVDTLGGLIYSQLGRVPEQGEGLEILDWRFTVLDINSRRIEQVQAERIVRNTPFDPEKMGDTAPERAAHQRVAGSTA
ncbi:MAG: hemolysin family protein [Caldilineaceae bacterium]|nr:hemolysin family protein [Caldilineaceae bacterium]HRJ41667.1 hemolysin family protein [Caldilineaceae bacterium]